ncbi:MAG: hypothetical protein HZB56_18200 [Deltaproteobacteria bacterium]|nr:hypothetical protein [Deltaproteobacteria bacterium]
MADRPELFHRIDEADSAAARRALAALGLVGRVELQNVFYESHAARLAALGGGTETPALRDGAGLHRGLAAVLAALGELAKG